ncbi:aldo/keto reductase [Nocardiopsis dassonvillei]|uniref:aldo/keto reductase n=1 Tax=Nocardiopsis dassonvillei TaxID=2014 RepID=UPI003F4D3DD9
MTLVAARAGPGLRRVGGGEPVEPVPVPGDERDGGPLAAEPASDGGSSPPGSGPVTGIRLPAHGRTPAQVMLRWHLQQGRSATPTSVKPHRIRENFDVFDFELTAEELASIDALDRGVRGGPEPAGLTLETASIEIPEA